MELRENPNRRTALEDFEKHRDVVNHPAHYTGKHECIEVMKQILSPAEFKGFLHGNVFKYVFRSNLKNGLEDLKKAQFYLNRLIAALEDKSNGDD